MTKTGQFLGSEGFAPPESYLDAHSVGTPGDIYSLGQLIAWATEIDPIPNVSPTAAPPWREAVCHMTQHETARRPQTMPEVLHLLAPIAGMMAK